MRIKSKNSNTRKKIIICMLWMFCSLAVVPAHAFQDDKKNTSQDKTITDQAEYDSYMKALNETSAAQKGALMVTFVEKYPKSVVLNDALANALAAYQAAGDEPNVAAVSNHILAIEPNHVRALAILTFITRQKASANNDVKLAVEAAGYAERGMKALLEWRKPEGMTDADFEKMGKSLSNIFYGALGFNAFVGKKYLDAKVPYLKALAVDPNNILDNYQLGISMLMLPSKDPTGLWYVAKATSLSKDSLAMHKVIEDFGKSAYKSLYRSDIGWVGFVEKVSKENAPPTPAPPKTALAKKVVKK